MIRAESLNYLVSFKVKGGKGYYLGDFYENHERRWFRTEDFRDEDKF